MPQAGSMALARLEKSRAGKSAEEIATEEGVTVDTVERSLTQANSHEFLEARTQIERKNNQLRRRVQRECEDKFVAGIGKLLDGEKEVALVVDGEVVVTAIRDPKALLNGLNQFMAAVAMTEKPAPAPAAIVNIQQNNNGRPPEKMEERIVRIRKAQVAGHLKAGLIDIEPIKSETEEPEKTTRKNGTENRGGQRWDF